MVEADQESVISSLVASGVGLSLMREDVALEREAAGEICLWDQGRAPRRSGSSTCTSGPRIR